MSVTLLLLLLPLTTVLPTAAATPTTVISSAGPLERIWIGDDLSCQVKHVNDADYQFYPPATTPGDCGTFVAIGTTLYAPDFAGHGGTATGSLGAYTAFTPVSQSPVSGTGTAATPYEITTTADAGASGIRIREVDRYVVGDDFYETAVTLTNTGGVSRSGVMYRAGDCFLGGSDTGYGAVGITSAGSIACTQNPNNAPAGRFEEFIPVTAGSAYYHDSYSTVWSWIGGKTMFPNTCQCTTFLDNGAGLSWDWFLQPGTSVTFVNRLRFDVPAPPPPVRQSASCTAHAIVVEETDSLGNNVQHHRATSTATTATVSGPTAVPATAPAPPLVPASHADAEEAGFAYSNGLVSVRASGLFSQCDLAAYTDGTTAMAHGYARAGVADLVIDVGGNQVALEVADHELDVRATSASTGASWACDLGEVEVLGPKLAAVCLLPSASIVSSPCFSLDVAPPYTTGPVLNAAGEWEYQGAALTLRFSFGGSCVSMGADLLIHVGYTRVAASGGAPSPPVYVPNTGCTPLAALCT